MFHCILFLESVCLCFLYVVCYDVNPGITHTILKDSQALAHGDVTLMLCSLY